MEGKQETLADKDLETGLQKFRDVLGRRCSLWTIIEKAETQENAQEKKDLVSLEDIFKSIKNLVMLLVQANDKVAYFRRLKVLNVSLNSKSGAKYIFWLF